MKSATLCFLIKDNKILLAMKKRGFGIGKWNGVGGKVKDNEDIKEAALRETEEEIMVTCQKQDLIEVGFLDFFWRHNLEWDQRVYLFLIKNWQGQPQETEEMKPKWYDYDNLPFQEMWPDDKRWLPVVLRGNKVEAEFYFSADCSEFDSYKVRVV